jgi:hypothetical protein
VKGKGERRRERKCKKELHIGKMREGESVDAERN